MTENCGNGSGGALQKSPDSKRVLSFSNLFPLPENIQPEGIISRLHFIIEFCATERFLEAVKEEDTFDDILKSLLKLVGENTKNFLSRPIHEQLEGKDEQQSDESIDYEIAVLSLKSLTNLSAVTSYCERIISRHALWSDPLTDIFFEISKFSLYALPILSNLTHEITNAEIIVECKPHYIKEAMMKMITSIELKEEWGARYCGFFLLNCSTFTTGLDIITGRLDKVVNDDFTVFASCLNSIYSEEVRLSIAGVIKNSCIHKQGFSSTGRDWHAELVRNHLLGPLLLPLVGSEPYSESENIEMLEDWRYQDATKQRDPSPRLRMTILETLCRLCSRREARELIRKQNAYYILREYHKWEMVSEIKDYLEDVINLVIRNEDEIGIIDLSDETFTNVEKCIQSKTGIP